MKSKIILLFGLTLGAATTLPAQLIFDNSGGATIFSSVEPFNSRLVGTYSYLDINGIPAIQLGDAAEQFVPTTSGLLQSVEVPLLDLIGAASVSVGIFSDNAGSIGSLLEIAQFLSPIPTYVGEITTNPYSTATFAGTTLLAAGTPYWVGLAANDGNTFAVWYLEPGSPSTIAYDQDQIGFNDPWTTPRFERQSARANYRLVGTLPVPEPSALGLLGLAGILVLLAGRRRRS